MTHHIYHIDQLNPHCHNKIGHDGKTYPPGTRKQLMKYIKQIIYNKRNIVIDSEQNNSKKKSKNKYISSSDDESFDS